MMDKKPKGLGNWSDILDSNLVSYQIIFGHSLTVLASYILQT